jgi:hypothetical protein
VEAPKVLPLRLAYWSIKVSGALADLIPLVLGLVIRNWLLAICCGILTKTARNFNNGLIVSVVTPENVPCQDYRATGGVTAHDATAVIKNRINTITDLTS